MALPTVVSCSITNQQLQPQQHARFQMTRNVVMLMSYIVVFALVLASIMLLNVEQSTARSVITSTSYSSMPRGNGDLIALDAAKVAATSTATFIEEPDSTALDSIHNHNLHHEQTASTSTNKTNESDTSDPLNEVDSARISYIAMLESDPSFRKSPFELSSDEWRPKWAKKQSRDGQRSIPPGQHVCFSHVGKAAGSTVGCSLGFQLHCHGTTMRSGVLPLYTTHVIHNGMNDCPSHMPYYLFTLRNPIDRIRSAYVYDRPLAPMKAVTPHERHDIKHRHAQDELYIDCPFWTLHEFVANGLDPNGKASQRCRERAIKSILGLERHGYHLYFNYQWFIQETQVMHPSSSSQILVVRTEHLAQDWNSAEAVMQSHSTKNNTGESEMSQRQNLTMVQQFQQGNPSSWKSKDNDAIFTDRDRHVLCHFLCREIQWYKQLLLQAVNLNSNDFFQSMRELHQTCPLQAKAGSCPSIDL
jgi:hypothetical protein